MSENPIIYQIAAVSVGIVNGVPVLDLDYVEDSNAETDMNIVMDENGKFIEVQGTAENSAFSMDELNKMLALAGSGIKSLMSYQVGK